MRRRRRREAMKTEGPVIPTEECDIVMKGGITSGVVYPSAVLRLSGRYRFRNVGGTSVGAIAAAVTAAAEFGRLRGEGTGFDELDVVNREMAKEGFLLSLFAPRPEARGLYSVYLAAIGRRGAVATAMAVLRQAPWVLAVLVAWWATLVSSAVWLGGRWWLVPVLLAGWAGLICLAIWLVSRRVGWGGAAAGVLMVVGWPLLIAPASVAASGWRDLSANGFGMVGGSSASGDALCDWLHRHIQAAAGLPENRPLTFGMLRNEIASDGKRAGISLRMVTTNLSTSRPMRVPDELEGYSFAREDLDGVLPASVIRWLEEQGTTQDGQTLLPRRGDLPVLLGFRLSLSFPLLFTAVRLRAPVLETRRSTPVPHWFSDGGIASNFPIHFFDAWMPRRPTFALSFAPFPVGANGRLLPDESDVGVPPKPNEPVLPRWVSVDGMGGFVAQILEVMQNWRDTLQSEIPGFLDRVYEARLDKSAGEGGLNLGMEVDTVRRLQGRGDRVGAAIVRGFDWDQHFFTRFLVAMQQLELGLLGSEAPTEPGGVQAAFSARRDRFSAGQVGAAELFGRDAAWIRAAGEATWALVTAAERWADFGRYVSASPRPRPVMRVTPDV
jgi:Patatin-like phospholipase